MPRLALGIIVGLLVPTQAWTQTPSLASALALLPAAQTAPESDPGFAPEPWTGSTGHLVALALLHTYRNTLARTDMEACAFHPSCSRFAQMAIDQSGFVRGILRGADRLLRDHPGVPHLGYAMADDGRHFLDPPLKVGPPYAGTEQPCLDCTDP